MATGKALRGRSTIRFIVAALMVVGCVAQPNRQESPAKDLARIQELYGQDRYAEAERLARAVLSDLEARANPDQLEIARVLDALAETGLRAGRIAEPQVLEAAARAIALKESALGPNHPEVASSVTRLAVLKNLRADYVGARRLYERALSIQEAAEGPDHPDVARTLGALAALFWKTGDYAQAKPLFERALAIREKALGPDDLEVAQSLSDLGTLLWKTGDYAGARPRFERALSIRLRKLGPDSPWVAASLNNLGMLLHSTGDLAAAKHAYEEAMAIREKTLGPEHPRVAAGLSNLGNVLQDLGDYTAARRLQERALAIREKAFGPEHPEVAQSLANLAEVLALSGERAAALERALRAEAIRRKHVRLTARGLSEREALAYASAADSGLHLALTLAAESGSGSTSARDAWDSLIRSRALVFDEMAARARAIPSTTEPETARLARNLASARERLARLVVRGPGGPGEPYTAAVERAAREEERAERDLAENSAAFRQELGSNRLGLREVAAALPSGAALVAFARYYSYDLSAKPSAGSRNTRIPSYLAFVLPGKDADSAVVALGPAAEIDAAVAAWRRQIRQEALAPGFEASTGACRKAGAKLRRRIWDPLVPYVHGARRVFVVPDGALHLVNFSALPSGASSYLLETGPLIHYLSAERDLVPAAPRAVGQGLLAMADPDFDATRMPPMTRSNTPAAVDDPGCATLSSRRFERLRSSASELERVVAIWKRGSDQSVTRLMGALASEAALKENAAGKRVLHLATHGFFLEPPCGSRAGPMENPLLRAGLALAGANSRASARPGEEDGILTAEEVAAIHLEGVEWAVLSACETGLGEAKAGEGVLGLQRAFRLAGAATVIMSLWAVEEESAREWMTALYQARLWQRLDTAQAVRHASLATLRARRAAHKSTHPFYWAGFVATGDWR